MSTVSSFVRSLETAPRIAGSSSCSSSARAVGTCAPPGGAPPKRGVVAGALVDERDRLVDDLDRAPVRLLGAVAPDDEPVLGEHDELEVGVGARRLADLLGEREAGPDVGDPRGGVAEALAARGARRRRVPASTLMPSGCVWWTCGAGTNACSSVSIEAARHRRVELAAREVGDHVLVAHLVALDQRQHLVEPQAGEVLRAHRREVASPSP